MSQRKETYVRQHGKYGHSCCKRCFGNEQSFKDARSRVMQANNPFKGKKHSEEAKRKLSEKAMGRPAWNKGMRKKKVPAIPGSINKWMNFKKTIIERDGNCWKCGSNNRIEVHHMASKKRFPEFYYDEANCITLCYWCHKEFHKRYTIRFFNYEDTIEWLNEGREEKDRLIMC